MRTRAPSIARATPKASGLTARASYVRDFVVLVPKVWDVSSGCVETAPLMRRPRSSLTSRAKELRESEYQ
jgi:hypothetical protein